MDFMGFHQMSDMVNSKGFTGIYWWTLWWDFNGFNGDKKRGTLLSRKNHPFSGHLPNAIIVAGYIHDAALISGTIFFFARHPIRRAITTLSQLAASKSLECTLSTWHSSLSVPGANHTPNGRGLENQRKIEIEIYPMISMIHLRYMFHIP